MRRSFPLMFLVMACLVAGIVGCAPQVPPRPEISQELPKLGSNYSRAYFFLGDMDAGVKMDLNKYGSAGNIYINSKDAGMINKGEYIAIDIVSGSYEIYWKPVLSDFDLSKHEFNKSNINFLPGETVYISANMRSIGSFALAFGGIGAIAADKLYVDTIEQRPLSSTSVKLVEYKVFNSSSNDISVSNINLTKSKVDTTNELSMEERLNKLKNLYDRKLITTEEYDNKRKEILKQF